MIQKLKQPVELKIDKKDFLKKHNRLFVMSKIATISPFIIFVGLSVIFQDWFLLFCIIFSYYGGILSEFGKPPLLITTTTVVLYSLLFEFIWNSYLSFFFFSYLYGHILFSLGTSFRRKLENKKFVLSNSYRL